MKISQKYHIYIYIDLSHIIGQIDLSHIIGHLATPLSCAKNKNKIVTTSNHNKKFYCLKSTFSHDKKFIATKNIKNIINYKLCLINF